MTVEKAKSAKPAAKAPQDRKPKAAAQPEQVTVEVQGISLTVDAEVLNDFELFDDLDRVTSKGDMTALVRVLRRITADQYDAVLDHLRDPATKKVSLQAVSTFFADFMGALNPNS